MSIKIPELKELRKIAKQLKITTAKKDVKKLFEEILDTIEKKYKSKEFDDDHKLIKWFNDNAPPEDGGPEEPDPGLATEPDPEPQKRTRKAPVKKKAAKAPAKKKAAKAVSKPKGKATAAKGKTKPQTAKEKAADAKKKKGEQKAVKAAEKKTSTRKAPAKREGPTYWEDTLALIQKAKKGISFEDLLAKLENKWPEKNEASLRNTIAYLKIKGFDIKQVNNLYKV